eukprot:TRINITY_DN71434_c0_g1_i1.p2 TRINITY_DN71434_c0_g1~~TRINITY_DN71434_c0_g1_i1.p2  ORF type:complete len:123 (+),score=6.71 TRINITY_DN71434_c0_g1_i1:81-449(+)
MHGLDPICRIADTWHTIGSPPWLTYNVVAAMYFLCPVLWPCLNFFGRLRVRLAFDLPLEPHRDCCVHVCCCPCCSPCGILQEARLTDAPIRLRQHRKRLGLLGQHHGASHDHPHGPAQHEMA